MEIKFLAFSDAHVEPGQCQDRFDWLGHLIVELQPEYVVQLGDFATMLSLSHWDANKRLLVEGRRFQLDIDAATQAVTRLFAPLKAFQEKKKSWKEKIYRPKIVWCEGNHEQWIQRYLEQRTEMEGHIKPLHHYLEPHLEKISKDITFVDYKDFIIIDGVAFTHCPIAANARPISGKYVSEKALDLFSCHIVFGHTHRFLHTHRYLHGHGLKQSVNSGCFFDVVPQYAKGAANEYFRTVVGISPREDGLLNIITMRW